MLLTKAFMKWDETNTAWIVLDGAGANTFTDVVTFNTNLFVAAGSAAAAAARADHPSLVRQGNQAALGAIARDAG